MMMMMMLISGERGRECLRENLFIKTFCRASRQLVFPTRPDSQKQKHGNTADGMNYYNYLTGALTMISSVSCLPF